ncbi:6-phosphogluconolactonase [Podarcis muralis]
MRLRPRDGAAGPSRAARASEVAAGLPVPPGRDRAALSCSALPSGASSARAPSATSRSSARPRSLLSWVPPAPSPRGPSVPPAGSLSASPAMPGSSSSRRGPAASAPHVSVFPSPQELGSALAQLVAQREAQCGPAGRFSLGLAGGSLVRVLAQELPAAAACPARWLLAFADERRVPLSDPESNYGAYQTYLLSKIAVPEDQIVVINPSLPVEEAAADYAAKLKEAFQGEDMPVFDLLILGVGPDGHTCSLFPDHSLLQEREKIVAAISDSPKPPPERITLTLPVLNAARSVVFVATGDSKAAVIKRILEGDEENPLPAALVQPHTGKLYWFLDEPAAKELTIPFEKHSIL